jgi:general secretion pathway protein M
MKQRWQQLNSREQALVISMSVLVVIFLLYTLFWQPLQKNIANTEKKITRQQELLTWVSEKTALYQQAKITAKPSSGSITGIVNRAARSNGITVTRMQPKGDELQVWIDEVPFYQLMLWLADLAETQGLQVQAIDINDTNTAGVVQVRRLQLGR